MLSVVGTVREWMTGVLEKVDAKYKKNYVISKLLYIAYHNAKKKKIKLRFLRNTCVDGFSHLFQLFSVQIINISLRYIWFGYIIYTVSNTFSYFYIMR